MTCRENVYELIRTLEELVGFNRNQHGEKSNYEISDIVSSTERQCRQVIHGIDQLFRKIGGGKTRFGVVDGR